MSAYNLSPLLTISSELLQAVRRSQSYLDTATELLRDTLAFDYHLATASVAQPANGGKDFHLDATLIDREAAYQVFIKIRHRKEIIDTEFPLLWHAASLLDYTSQMTVNVLPATQRKARHYANIAEGGNLSFPWNDPNSMEHSLAVYLGISPFPFFLGDLDSTTPSNTALLSPFGFGVYAYLAYTVIPELALRRVPPDIYSQWDVRPIARGGVRNAPDGSFRLTG